MALQRVAPQERSRNLAYYYRHKERLRRTNNARRAFASIRKFGVSLVWYLAQHHFQDGRCACCGERETALNNEGSGVKRLAIDHDHNTGEVRELLCQRCNLMVSNDADRLRAGAAYLERHAHARLTG